jgi:hypothetical protein
MTVMPMVYMIALMIVISIVSVMSLKTLMSAMSKIVYCKYGSSGAKEGLKADCVRPIFPFVLHPYPYPVEGFESESASLIFLFKCPNRVSYCLPKSCLYISLGIEGGRKCPFYYPTKNLRCGEAWRRYCRQSCSPWVSS